METVKKHFKQSQVLVPVFFLVFGSLTLIVMGCTYTTIGLHHLAKPCFMAGIILAGLSIMYSLLMAFLSKYVEQLCKFMVRWKKPEEVAEAVAEDGLSIHSEDVLAADGDGIAFGPKRRRKTSKDTLCELSSVKKDSFRETEILVGTMLGSLESQSQHSWRIPSVSGTRRLSQSGRPNFPGHAIDLGEQDESEGLETAPTSLYSGHENSQASKIPLR